MIGSSQQYGGSPPIERSAISMALALAAPSPAERSMRLMPNPTRGGDARQQTLRGMPAPFFSAMSCVARETESLVSHVGWDPLSEGVKTDTRTSKADKVPLLPRH